MTGRETRMTSTHWGAYRAVVEDDRIVEMRPFEHDPSPSPIGQSIPDALNHPTRVTKPMFRKGWLDDGPGDAGGRRGRDAYVAVDWDKAIDLVAGELSRVRDTRGNEAIYAGSYGWSSAGRLHNAAGQLHRFLNGFGGYVYSVNTYSTGAGHVIIPHVFGMPYPVMMQFATTPWSIIAEHTELLVMFGGIGTKNAQACMGGATLHRAGEWLERFRDNGIEFVNVSPLRSDSLERVDADWLAVRPGSDVALMLGLAHVLETGSLVDHGFLESHCIGYDRFRLYLLGETDGVPKTPEWAESLCTIPAQRIRDLARRMAAKRCMITASWSVQRGEHGEQPFWMAATLAAMLGQIGLPGGGVGYGYGAVSGVGNAVKRYDMMSVPLGTNAVDKYIPVARVADMLLGRGETFDYNGQVLTYPDIKLVYWCGGNPFHHHQDLNRLRRAWQKPETVIVHDPWWTATAKHADIVLPANTPWERNDIGRGMGDHFVIAMQQLVPSAGDARSDYEIFSDLAGHLGFRGAFTEGRDERDWLEHLYDRFRQSLAEDGVTLPGFDDFWADGYIELPLEGPDFAEPAFAAFRDDPEANALRTPSGKIEIFSETVAGFGYDDCPGHATWIEPTEWLGGAAADRHPLHLLSPQPLGRLHSQLDVGKTSRENKVDGREPVTIHPDDAGARGIAEGDVVRLFNDRGACLAAARVSDDIRPGVVALPTGAWLDAGDGDSSGRALERHGNPNVLTQDKGTSRLGQGTSAHSALVEVERFDGELPAIRAHEPPEIVAP